MSTTPAISDSFFYYFNLALLFTVVFAFGGYSIMGKSQFNSWPPIIAIHGLSVLLWYGLVVYQSRLIGNKDIETHKKIGQRSLVLAITIIISGFAISITNYQVENMAAVLLANSIFILCFAVLFSLAIWYRFKPDIHKRLIVLASIAMLPPALARIARIFAIDEQMLGPPFLLLFISALVIYDIRKSKRIHSITIAGTIFIILSFSTIEPIGNSEAWNDLVLSLIKN